MLRGQAALAGARKTWRIGLIGAGRWGQVYIRTLGELGDRCRLTHVASRRPETNERLAPSVAVVADWREAVHADCDALIIATPPATHAEMLEACLEAGKPCIVEKPLCLDLATAERLHRLVEAAGVPVLVNHTQLFHPAYQALKHAVRSSGEPLRAIVAEGMDWGPFRRETPALWDWGPHDLSLCLDLTGQLPEDVQVLEGLRSPQGSAEIVSLRLEFPGGLCASIQVGCLSVEPRRRLAVMTERAVFAWDDDAPRRLAKAPLDWDKRYEGDGEQPLVWETLPVERSAPPMTEMLTYFLQGLEGGDRSYFGCRLALDVARILSQCQ